MSRGPQLLRRPELWPATRPPSAAAVLEALRGLGANAPSDVVGFPCLAGGLGGRAAGGAAGTPTPESSAAASPRAMPPPMRRPAPSWRPQPVPLPVRAVARLLSAKLAQSWSRARRRRHAGPGRRCPRWRWVQPGPARSPLLGGGSGLAGTALAARASSWPLAPGIGLFPFAVRAPAGAFLPVDDVRAWDPGPDRRW